MAMRNTQVQSWISQYKCLETLKLGWMWCPEKPYAVKRNLNWCKGGAKCNVSKHQKQR